MTSAVNVEQQRRLKDRENYDLALLIEAAKAVLNTTAGRIWTNFILENVCRADVDPFSPDASIAAYNTGIQSVSRSTKHFITEHVGVEWLKKLHDARFEDLAEQRATRELTDG